MLRWNAPTVEDQPNRRTLLIFISKLWMSDRRKGGTSVLIEGQDKINTLAKALGEGPAEAMPIRAVLRRAADRLTIFVANRA